MPKRIGLGPRLQGADLVLDGQGGLFQSMAPSVFFSRGAFEAKPGPAATPPACPTPANRSPGGPARPRSGPTGFPTRPPSRPRRWAAGLGDHRPGVDLGCHVDHASRPSPSRRAIRAQLMGAAPRYLGSSEAWRLMPPRRAAATSRWRGSARSRRPPASRPRTARSAPAIAAC